MIMINIGRLGLQTPAGHVVSHIEMLDGWDLCERCLSSRLEMDIVNDMERSV